MTGTERAPRAAVILALVACWAATACSDAPTGVPPDGALDLAAPWTVVDPAAVDLDGNALFVAAELAGRIERMRSLVVVRRGRIAFERYYAGWTADSLADVRSVTKSVVSTLVGIAVDEGHIRNLDEPLTTFLRRPDFAVREEHGAITVRHLLTMTGGFEWREGGTLEYNEWVVAADPVDYLLERPVSAPPGRDFTYNSAAVHLLGVLLERATGLGVAEYADRVLLGPLGIGRRRWEELAGGRVNGGAGLDLRPRDLARFGQLFLQNGWSGHRRVLPEGWVTDATTPHVDELASVGPVRDLAYGYLWWLDVERDAFFAWGYGGQFVYVRPALELVVVATTDWRGVSRDIGSSRLEEEVLGVVVERVGAAAR